MVSLQWFINTDPFYWYHDRWRLPITNGNYPTHGSCILCFTGGPLGEFCSQCYENPPGVYKTVVVQGLSMCAKWLALECHQPFIKGPGRPLVRWNQPPRHEMTEEEFLEIFGTQVARHKCTETGPEWTECLEIGRTKAQEFLEHEHNSARWSLLSDFRDDEPWTDDNPCPLQIPSHFSDEEGVRLFRPGRDYLLQQQQQQRQRRQARENAERQLRYLREMR